MATKREPSDMKLAPFALTVAGLLAGCGSTMPTAPPASPRGQPSGPGRSVGARQRPGSAQFR